MKDKTPGELVESVMELPREMLKLIEANAESIQMLNIQVDRLMRLIAGLHDIDLKAIREDYQSLSYSAKK